MVNFHDVSTDGVSQTQKCVSQVFIPTVNFCHVSSLLFTIVKYLWLTDILHILFQGSHLLSRFTSTIFCRIPTWSFTHLISRFTSNIKVHIYLSQSLNGLRCFIVTVIFSQGPMYIGTNNNKVGVRFHIFLSHVPLRCGTWHIVWYEWKYLIVWSNSYQHKSYQTYLFREIKVSASLLQPADIYGFFGGKQKSLIFLELCSKPGPAALQENP